MKIALLGNQNSGKTTLFNTLTGASAHTGNFPGVTVERKSGFLKNQRTKLKVINLEDKNLKETQFYKDNDGTYYEKIEFVDLPGIYSFSPYTDEEIVSRNFIIDERPDAVINVVDASNIERNLYLTLQALEIDVPIVIALNFMDIAKKKHIKIDKAKLEKILGVPVVEISALKKKGIDELIDRCIEVRNTKRIGSSLFSYESFKKEYESISNLLKEKFKSSSLAYHTVKLLEKDEIELKSHSDIKNEVIGIIDNFEDKEEDFPAIIADARYKYISSILPMFYSVKDRVFEKTASDKADRLLTSKWFGIPIFIVIMAIIFHFTFSNDFLFLSSVITKGTFNIPIIGTDSINSPGVMLAESIKYLTDNIIGSSISNALSSSPQWVSSFFVDGLWAGISAVLSFIPQIIMLFIFISLLEDSGYMARICFLFDKFLRKFGMSGKAFLPLLTCFGCSVPAILSTKILSTEKEKESVIRLSPFLSCGAKLPIRGAFAAVLFNGMYVDLVVLSIYFIGIILAIIVGLILHISNKKPCETQFILELPEYHMPQSKSVLILVWQKMKDYLIRVTTVVTGGLVVIWILSHISLYPGYIGYVQPETINIAGEDVLRISQYSILGQISTYLAYLFYPLGFGIGETGWTFVASAFTGFIAKEMVPASLISLGGGNLQSLIHTLPYSNAAIYSFMLFNLTTIPCISAVSAAKSQLSKKSFIKTLIFWFGFSYLFSAFVFGIGAAIELFWWISIILVIVIVSIIVLLFILTKKKEQTIWLR